MNRWLNTPAFTGTVYFLDDNGNLASDGVYAVTRGTALSACMACIAWGFFTDIGRSISQALIATVFP